MEHLNWFIALSFSYPFLFGLINIIDSRLSNNSFRNPATLIFYMSLTNIAFLPIILFFGMPTLPSVLHLLCYFLLALLNLVYQIPYYIALKKIDTSIVGALFSLGRVWVPVLTFIFLGEKLGILQYIGFAAIIFSSVALSVKNFKLPKINAAFYLMLLSSSIRSVFSVLEKYTIDADGNWINMVIYPSVLETLIAMTLLSTAKQRQDIIANFNTYKKTCGSFISMEFMAFIATSIMFYVLPYISAVTKTSISATMPIFILFSGLFLEKCCHIKMNEALSRGDIIKKLFFFMLMTFGVYWVVS